MQKGEQGEAPLPTMLPTGQPCIAQASLASLMPCDVILRHISVEPPASSSEQDSPGLFWQCLHTLLLESTAHPGNQPTLQLFCLLQSCLAQLLLHKVVEDVVCTLGRL